MEQIIFKQHLVDVFFGAANSRSLLGIPKGAERFNAAASRIVQHQLRASSPTLTGGSACIL